MAHDSRDCFDSRDGHGDSARQTQRREFLRALAGGLGFFAAGGSALGESLLVRTVASPQPSFEQPTTTTMSWSYTLSYSITSIVPQTITWVGRSTAPKAPGTYTQTTPPVAGRTESDTETYPAPGGQTQPITIVISGEFSYTPPMTNYQTESWQGSYYTLSSSHIPSLVTISSTETTSASYTTVTTKAGGFMEGMSPSGEDRQTLAPAADGSDVSIDAIDAPDYDLRLPSGRRTQAPIVRFTHGIVS